MSSRRILIFSVDILPSDKLPASGGGMRARQLRQALVAQGHEVVVSTSTSTFLARTFAHSLSQETLRLSYSARPQPAICAEVKPDLVLFASNWSSVDGDWWPECPAIVDLCGPVTLELALSNNTGLTGLATAFQRKVEVLAKADLLLCGGERQAWYFRQAAALAGYDPLQPLPLCHVPMAVEADLIRERTYPQEPVFVYAGGLYPWQDPTFGVESVLEAVERHGRGRLHWYGGSHQATAGDLCPEFCAELRQCSVSLELMAPNLERELAVTTRTLLNLALGLPVLYGDYGELSAPIRQYEAGWILRHGDQNATREVLDEIIRSPDEIQRRGANAQRLARERFTTETTCGPLVAFAANPVIRANKQAVARGLGGLTPGELRLLQSLRAPLWRPVRFLMGRFFKR
jgi:hypothetical protein